MENFGESEALLLLLSADQALEQRIEEWAAAADWRVETLGDRFDWPGDRAIAAAPALILCDIRSGSETDQREIVSAAQYAAEHALAFIAWTDMERLDEAAFLAGQADAQLLVDPQRAETVFALTSVRGRLRWSVRENRGDSPELIRLSDELVDMARRIAAFTRAGTGGGLGGNGGGQVRSDPLAFRGAPADGALPLGSDEPPPIAPAQLREMIRLRRMREDAFESHLFADPAWDMLLDLMASRLEGRSVSVSSLCIASAVPATTALRWIKLMTDRGLLERRADTADGRRIFIGLSDETAARLQRLLGAMLARAGPSV